MTTGQRQTPGVSQSWSAGPVNLHTGDAYDVLANMPDATVDCIVPLRRAIARVDHSLDASTPPGMDGRPRPAHPAMVRPRDSAADPRSDADREPGRTPDSCPPYPRPTPGSAPSHATGPRQAAGRDTPHPHGSSSDPADRR